MEGETSGVADQTGLVRQSVKTVPGSNRRRETCESQTAGLLSSVEWM
jgi:hypothetical protein